jgi:hypothetical protein
MRPFGTRYPVVLQAVMNHAQRLRLFLEERERRTQADDPGASWLIGRAGEIQCVVALAALDWHQSRLSGEGAASVLARYIKDIHDGMAMHLDIGMPPCCRAPLARTAGPGDSKRPRTAARDHVVTGR